MSKRNKLWLWLIIFAIVMILVIPLLNKLNLNSPQEFKDSKEQAKRRRKKLETIIEKKKALKEKLTKRFNRAYFVVRFLFVAFWSAYILLLIQLQWIQDLEDALNYSEAAILIWIALNFLIFGNLSNLNSFVQLIKLKLENWIWGKYINIDESIEINKTELANT